MAEDRRDPPWGRPPGTDDESHQQESAAPHAPQPPPQNDPNWSDAPTQEQSGDYGQQGAEEAGAHGSDDPHRHGGPVAEGDEHGQGGDAGATGGAAVTRDEEDVPDNIRDQTRGDESPYQWHAGLNRPHGSSDAVEFIDVMKSFGRNTILNGLNLGIPDNQISMILGPSGTGKSVCIKHMVGLLYPDEGDVLVHGQSVPNMQDEELFDMRKKFGVLFQDGALFGSMNVFDNTAFPLRQHTDRGESEIIEIVTRRLAEVGLGGAMDKMPNELSGGMRKRAGFARALVLDPDIVLFDEPDSGLDPVRTALLCELIQEVHEENGGAYVVITHDIMSARRVADFISVLWKGRIVESGPASELFNSDNQFVRQFLSGEAQGPLGME